jgi:hypothetical protein
MTADRGQEVRDCNRVHDALVFEVTDPPGMASNDRKRRQEARPPSLPRAKLLKIADKACNVFDALHHPDEGWSREVITLVLSSNCTTATHFLIT